MKLLWLDLETTGLDPQKDRVLEVAAAVADLSRPFEPGYSFESVFRIDVHAIVVDPFVLEMHTKNGLWEECLRSERTLADAEDRILSMLPPPEETREREDRPVLAGSTVHFDLGFLRIHMPALAARLSHRCYDVSAVKLFCQSLGMPKPPRAEAHRALADVLESVAHAKLCAEWLGRTR